jgi:hypothetical protein
MKKAELLNQQWKDKEFNNHCSKCKVIRIWQAEGLKQIYIEFVQYINNTVYGMELKDFERCLKIYQ